MKKETYKIHGIHCASCVVTIEKALSKVDGVKMANVNFASETALVEFDDTKIKFTDLAKAIDDVGYKLSNDRDNQVVPDSKTSKDANNNGTVLFQVLGMDSPHCAMIVEKAIKSLPGIQNIDVDFSNTRAKAVFNPQTVSIDQISKIITDAGYKPIIESQNVSEVLKDVKSEHEHQVKKLKIKLSVGSILTILIFIGSFSDRFSFLPQFMSSNLTLLILTIPVQFWVGSQFYVGLKLMWKYKTADMNTLIAIGTLSAFIYSAVVTVFPGFFTEAGQSPQVYFDTASIIIVLILLGKYFEALMKGRASNAIKKLIGLQPKLAMVIRDGKEIKINIEQVLLGDLIIVRPGEKIPTDGVITEGESEIDESMVTGESMPVHKITGSGVIGSTVNKFGTFTFKATKVGKDTMLSRIVKMVEEAQGSKAPIQRLADKVASYFVPVVIIISILTFIIWLLFGPDPAFNFALINFMAILIIACPCALGLATPMAIMVSFGSSAKRGILVKDASSLEIANKIDAIILDKTGTLTVGKPQLTDILVFTENSKEEILKISASLEQRSEHPLSKAILNKFKQDNKDNNVDLYSLENFKAISGKGVSGNLDIQSQKTEVSFGNRALMIDIGLDVGLFDNQIKEVENEGKTVMVLAVNKKIIGALAVADVVKKESLQAVKKIQKMGVEVWMLTGDNDLTARAIAKEVGIKNIMSDVLPAQKSEKIRELQKKGRVVAMVGDGINDAPALTQADVGIAMGEGTDIAMESANITLMRGDLMLIPETIKISKRTMRIIKQNLFWAFFYNSAFIPVAAGVLYPFFGILLSPIFAAGAMVFSSISVVLNSLRLKKIV